MMRTFFVGIFWIISSAKSAPLHYTEVSVQAVQYLSLHGYFEIPDPRVGLLLDETAIKKSLESLQRFANIPVTGVFDEKTANLIVIPRCGLPDISKTHDTRKRRYAIQGTRWQKSKLTWKLLNDNNDGLSRSQVEDTLLQAFARWEAVTNLNFRKLELNSTEKVDIEVSFAQDYHKDPYPFDGPGGTLAHAFYPHNNEGLSGDLHFDDAEQFTVSSPSGRNLLWIAVHEIGHSIGLEHSNIQDSIMFPWYKGYMGDNFPLTQDDIFGIQTIYGSKAAQTTESTLTTTPTAKISPSKVPCSMKGGVFEKSTGVTYIFNGNNLYKIDQYLKNTEGPFNVSKILPEVKSVDAAYVNSRSEVVFFKGTSYYIYKSLSELVLIENGSIFDKFIGLRNTTQKIDGAFIWTGNGKTYLFTGDLFYRFSDYSNVAYYDYPRKISEYWKGIPGQIDSVFVWKNGVTYFFKGSQFYRMNERAEVENYYPKSIGGSWMQCR